MPPHNIFFDCIHCGGSVYQGIDTTGEWENRGVLCMLHNEVVVCGDCPEYEPEEEQ